MGDLIDSLTMLERRGIVGAKTGLLPGHGDPQPDALAHLIRIRGALEKRNARLATALQDVGAASLWALLPQVFRNGQQSDGHMALRLLVVLGHLRHLARTGRAVLDRQPDGTWRARGVYGRMQRIG